MEPTKTQDNVRQQAISMKAPMVEFLQRHLMGFGNVVDQLRVMGYLGQAMVEMAEGELRAIKMADEAEEKAKIKVYQ